MQPPPKPCSPLHSLGWELPPLHSQSELKHTDTHKCNKKSAECRMLKLQRKSAQLEKTAKLILALSDYKHTQAHVHEAIQSVCLMQTNQEKKKGEAGYGASPGSRASLVGTSQILESLSLQTKVTLSRVCMSCSENERLQRWEEAAL